MGGESALIVLAALFALMLVAALLRRVASGWRRDALSIALVVLALLTAFVLFFSAGTLVRRNRPQAVDAWPIDRVLTLSVEMIRSG
jgi:hypothetical protein